MQCGVPARSQRGCLSAGRASPSTSSGQAQDDDDDGETDERSKKRYQDRGVYGKAEPERGGDGGGDRAARLAKPN